MPGLPSPMPESPRTDAGSILEALTILCETVKDTRRILVGSTESEPGTADASPLVIDNIIMVIHQNIKDVQTIRRELYKISGDR